MKPKQKIKHIKYHTPFKLDLFYEDIDWVLNESEFGIYHQDHLFDYDNEDYYDDDWYVESLERQREIMIRNSEIDNLIGDDYHYFMKKLYSSRVVSINKVLGMTEDESKVEHFGYNAINF